MSKPDLPKGEAVLQHVNAIPLVQEILALSLFADAEQPVALLASPDKVDPSHSDKIISEYQVPTFPGSIKVYQAANDLSYLDQLKHILSEEKPDCLFLLPPLATPNKVPASLRHEYPGLGLHEIALQTAVENAPQGCRIGVWLPRGFFVNASSQFLREKIAQEMTPRLIVEFAQELPLFPAFMQLLVLDTGALGDRLVRFFRIPGSVLEDMPEERQAAILADFRRLLGQGGGQTEFGFVLREGLTADAPWLFHRHHPNYQKRIADLEYFGGVRPLGELVDIWLGFQNSQMVNALIPGHEVERGIAVLEGREIGLDGALSKQEPRYRILEESAGEFVLQAGDICMRSILTPSQHLVTALINEDMLPLAVNNGVIVLRPKPEINLDPEFLAAYLRSDHVVHSLRAQGIAQRLYGRSLADVQVPMQDEELAEVMQDLRHAAHTLGAWQEEARAAIRSLFSYESAKDARAYLLASGRRVRQRERAALQVDDLSYRLRTGLPHPLAYRWRMAETAPSTLEGYLAVLECAEAAICYLALAALVLMRAVEETVPYLSTLVPRLSDPERKSGTNFGDWLAIVRDVNGRRKLKEAGNVPFYQVARFLDDAAVNDALSVLKNNRDDQAHGRGPHGTELEAKFTESQQALSTLFEALEFLSEYSLRYVETTNRDTLSGVTHYRFRELMGDHPLVATLEAETSTAELEAESLYLMDRTGELYLLRPYLVRAQCPQCGGWESYYLDRYDARSGCCTLKSLEKGHTVEHERIAAAFRQVFLLA